jgi:hypothetical protein
MLEDRSLVGVKNAGLSSVKSRPFGAVEVKWLKCASTRM